MGNMLTNSKTRRTFLNFGKKNKLDKEGNPGKRDRTEERRTREKPPKHSEKNMLLRPN